ncbi:MAG: putative acetyl-CoA acyltransferase [Streptosporangiaceae bacterium]|jgi:acetyl-CoA acyltransferase|nr:putative acetyl-CoA acyltransferase [Streptosporangiaceae bacterium]
MSEAAVIVDAIRTPSGRRNGLLGGWHAADLAGAVLESLRSRNDLDPALIDDVIMGCVSQVGDQSVNIGRSAVLAAGWPESVPATTIDRQCGSSQQAAHFAAQGVIAGAYDVVIAAGVEVMTRTPMGATSHGGDPFGPRVRERYAEVETYGHRGLIGQGLSAELIADRWNLTRADLDAYGLRSQLRAARARDGGRFDREIIPVEGRAFDPEKGEAVSTGGIVGSDQGIRASTGEGLADLKPAFLPDGKVTAGNSSQIADGASAVLIMSERRAVQLGLTPRARFHSFVVAADDPIAMLTAPIPATRRILDRSGLGVDDIDLVEINEAFASVVLAWQKETGFDLDRVNVNGGAIALGHPLGASGTKLMATLLCELERTGGRYGLQTMCEGAGQANATIIERL